MANLQVTSVHRDNIGNTLAICGPWGINATLLYTPEADAIRNIELGTHTYYVWWPDNVMTLVHVVDGSTKKYLRTDKDHTTKNNLDDLPTCHRIE